ncbi:MAG: RNA polymerase sigma factor [Bacteroidia bacterium]
MNDSKPNRELEMHRIHECLAGDAKAQEALYRRFANPLYTICLRYMGEPDGARDMLQEVWIKVFTKLGEFKAQGSFEGWLRRIAVTTCLDGLKKDRLRFSEDVEAFQEEVSWNQGQDSQLDAKRLMQLIERLPVGYRTVFNLYAIEGFGHAEIAEMLAISENTSKSQLHKARKWLQERLNYENFHKS